MLRLDRLAEVGIVGHLALLEFRRREDVGTGEDRLAAQRPDAGGVEHALLAADLGRLALAHGGAHQAAAGDGVGRVDVARGLEQAALVVGRDAGEERAVGDDLLQQRGGGAEAREEGGVRGRAR